MLPLPQIVRWSAIVILAFFTLHSFMYGLGFVTDPVNGAAEFGANDPATEAATNLAGLVGVLMILMAATALTGAVLLVRRLNAGAWLGATLGVVAMSIGGYWAVVGWAWDAWFYSIVGAILVATNLWLATGGRLAIMNSDASPPSRTALR